jgi:putative ABC transport system permease protein
MLRNFFKTAWRNLVNNRVYSALNILGLATGMAVALLIGLWVYYQVSFDRFLPDYERVYIVMNRYNNNGKMEAGEATSLPLADALKKEVPGIKYVAQADWLGKHSLVVGDKKLYPAGAMAGADFLKIFQYALLKGNVNVVLNDPYSIVLTESTAKALFGTEDPINKMVRFDNASNLKVTGILKDVPANSSLQFKFIVPFTYCLQNYGWVKSNIGNWRDKSFQTFVALEPNVSYAQVAPKIKVLEKNHNPQDYKLWKTETFLHPLKDKHLYNEFEHGFASGGLIDYVKMFGFIGLLVLLIACINFMNLSTAQSEKRAREVGVRKAIGSQRISLILQFLVESVLLTFVSFILSLLLVQLALPALNMLTKSEIRIPYNNATFWLVMMAYVLLTGLLAGSRPAFYLSSFQPVKVLKGAIQTGGAAAIPRKILVVLQFACSIALIISTILIY